ncbi:MAG: TrmH family RNA methyltransferase, partial [Candidatus Cryptobacteroides sp.]
QKKFRDREGLFTVEGEKMVEEAVKSGFGIVDIYRKDEIGEDKMSRISLQSSPSPVLAVVRMPSVRECAEVPGNGLYIGLDSIRDPGNLGTIIRIADWFGIRDIFATGDTVDVFNPKTVQATMGAVFRVKVHYGDLRDTARKFLDAGGKVYGTFLDGRDIYGCDLSTGADCPVLVVIGNESNGISDSLASLVSDRLHIPPFPDDSITSESLNAAVATAVTIAEFRRRFRTGL